MSGPFSERADAFLDWLALSTAAVKRLAAGIGPETDQGLAALERVADTPEGATIRCSHFPSGRVKLVAECGAVSVTVHLSPEQVAVLFAPDAEVA